MKQFSKAWKWKNQLDKPVGRCCAKWEVHSTNQIESTEVSSCGFGSRPESRTISSNDHISKLLTIIKVDRLKSINKSSMIQRHEIWDIFMLLVEKSRNADWPNHDGRGNRKFNESKHILQSFFRQSCPSFHTWRRKLDINSQKQEVKPVRDWIC